MSEVGSFAPHVRPSRVILGLLLVYQAVFLNVLVPGHTRGAITLDGKHTAPCCCCSSAGEPRPGGKAPTGPSDRDREHCAVCQFAAALTSVPPVRFTLPELGLLDVLPAPLPSVVCSLDRIATYDACGPPLSPARV